MLAFIIQRLLQAAVVMLIISVMVFVGVYAVGNPIDVMIPQMSRSKSGKRRFAPMALTNPCGTNTPPS